MRMYVLTLSYTEDDAFSRPSFVGVEPEAKRTVDDRRQVR